jgi:hypothetical protein
LQNKKKSQPFNLRFNAFLHSMKAAKRRIFRQEPRLSDLEERTVGARHPRSRLRPLRAGG